MVNKDDKRLLLKVAYGYFQEGKYDRALEEYQRLIRLDPKDFNLYLMVGDIQARKNNHQEAIRMYLTTAGLQREQGYVDKELVTCRKVLRLDAGNAQALTRFHEAMELKLQEIRRLLTAGKLEEAEAMGRKLLEMDESQLQVHKVLDEISEEMILRASQAEARQEPVLAAEIPDPTEEVIRKLKALAESYLGAEDFENAIESYLTILKFDATNADVRQRLAETQDALEKKRQAETVWAKMQAEEIRRLDDVKQTEIDEEARLRWEREEAEAKVRMQAELQAVEAQTEKEKAILEKAVAEFRENLARQEAAQQAGPAPEAVVTEEGSRQKLREIEDQAQFQARQLKEKFDKETAEREARLRAETESLKAQLQKERLEAEDKAREKEERQRSESELMRQQMELTKLESEAKARQVAAEELGRRLEQERRHYEEQMARQREELAQREEAFRQQMEGLMREQVQKLEKEVREKSLADLRYQMDQQNQARQKVEAEAKARDEAVLAALKAQHDAQLKAQAEAAGMAQSKRAALEKMKDDEEQRRLQMFQAAQQRRETRLDGPQEEKAEVLKASRRISDAMRAAATKHIEQDLPAMISTAHSYVRQDLLTDAMRMCQKIAEADPKNEEVKVILKEIFAKKGL